MSACSFVSQWKMRAMEHRAGRDGCLRSTSAASDELASAQLVTLTAAATSAAKSFRPARFAQVRATRIFRRESLLKLEHRSRKRRPTHQPPRIRWGNMSQPDRPYAGLCELEGRKVNRGRVRRGWSATARQQDRCEDETDPHDRSYGSDRVDLLIASCSFFLREMTT